MKRNKKIKKSHNPTEKEKRSVWILYLVFLVIALVFLWASYSIFMYGGSSRE